MTDDDDGVWLDEDLFWSSILIRFNCILGVRSERPFISLPAKSDRLGGLFNSLGICKPGRRGGILLVAGCDLFESVQPCRLNILG